MKKKLKKKPKWNFGWYHWGRQEYPPRKGYWLRVGKEWIWVEERDN